MLALPVTIVIPSSRVVHCRLLLDSLVVAITAHSVGPLATILVGNRADLEPLRTEQSSPLGLTIVSFESTNVSAKRNSGVKQAKGNWILFLDDDVIVPDIYFLRVQEALVQTKAVVIQGLAARPPPGAGYLAKLEAVHYARTIRRDWSLANKTGLGQLDPRNLLIQRETALAFPFDERLPYGGEGHEILRRLVVEQRPLSLRTSLTVFHFHRTSLFAAITQRFKYGRGRAVMIKTCIPKNERRNLLLSYWKRHFLWTSVLFGRSKMSVREYLYSIVMYVWFWMGVFWQYTQVTNQSAAHRQQYHISRG